MSSIPKGCIIKGCGKPINARGWCHKHYKRWIRHGDPKHQSSDWRVKHGRVDTPEWWAWRAARRRCNNPNAHNYKDYGGRGITFYKGWDDFKVFLAHVGYRPSPNHSIDRIDNNRGYEPGNVRWATPKEQANNRRPVQYTEQSSKQCSGHKLAA